MANSNIELAEKEMPELNWLGSLVKLPTVIPRINAISTSFKLKKSAEKKANAARNIEISIPGTLAFKNIFNGLFYNFTCVIRNST